MNAEVLPLATRRAVLDDTRPAICAERLGFVAEALREVTRTALEAAFCEEKLKENLINALR